jgi:hypothetical protein
LSGLVHTLARHLQSRSQLQRVDKRTVLFQSCDRLVFFRREVGHKLFVRSWHGIGRRPFFTTAFFNIGFG